MNDASARAEETVTSESPTETSPSGSFAPVGRPQIRDPEIREAATPFGPGPSAPASSPPPQIPFQRQEEIAFGPIGCPVVIVGENVWHNTTIRGEGTASIVKFDPGVNQSNFGRMIGAPVATGTKNVVICDLHLDGSNAHPKNVRIHGNTLTAQRPLLKKRTEHLTTDLTKEDRP